MNSKLRVYTASTLLVSGLALGYSFNQGLVSASQGPVTPSAVAPVSAQPVPLTEASVANSGGLESLFVGIADKTIPSVVNISTKRFMRAPRGFLGRRQALPDDIWQRFFDADQIPQDRDSVSQPSSLGSGFVIEASANEGLILTNYHVIAGADEVGVKFTESDSERETPAVVIGRDPDLDLALLKVKTKNQMKAIPMGDSEALKVGEWVAAVGNPFGHGHSVSHGIVSAKARALPGGFGKYLQVDAPINPGNSGGPLVNLRGEVIGINNAIDARGPGIGFAIPINAVKSVLAQLKNRGSVERGFIGINIGAMSPSLAKQLDLDQDLRSPVVTHVLPGLAAEKAGLKPYDVIVAVNGDKVDSPDQLVESITRVPVGQKVNLKVLRSGREMSLAVPVAKRPDPESAS